MRGLRFTRTASLAHSYQRLFETADGEAVLQDLAKFCGADQDIHTPGDPFTTASNAGKFRVFQRICGLLNMSPQRMMKIAQQERQDHGEEFGED